LKRGGNRKL